MIPRMKINFIAALLAAITLCSCSHDKGDYFHAKVQYVNLKLAADMTDDSQDTKTIFSSNQNIWSEDDIIGVAIGENSSLVRFELEEGAGTTKGVFAGDVRLFNDFKIYAVYPFMDIVDVKSIPLSIGERVYQGDYQFYGDFSDYAKYSFLAGSSTETYTVQDTTFIEAPSINLNYISSMIYFMIESFSEHEISIDSIDLLCEGNDINNVYAESGTLNLVNSDNFRISPTQLTNIQTVNISPETPLVLNNGDVKYVKIMSFPVDYEDGTDLMIRLNGHINGTAVTLTTAKRIDSSSSISPGQMRGLYIPISHMNVPNSDMVENAFASGATNVTIEQEKYGIEYINLPDLSANSNKSISLEAKIVNGSNYCFRNDEKSPEFILNNFFVGEVDEAGRVTIELPQTPTFLSGSYKSVTAQIDEDKLIVEKNAIIDSLGIRSGDVYIHGNVNILVAEENYNGRVLIENGNGGMVDIIPVQEISLTQTEYVKHVGNVIPITYITNPSDATFPNCTVRSSNPKVAYIENGLINCKMIGSAVITVSGGTKRAYITVNVVPTPVDNIYLDLNEHTMRVGDTVFINATVEPDDATDKAIKWSSSDNSVAKVENGVVTALKVGSATITATAGELNATCEITVEPTPVTSISLNKNSETLRAGQSVTLTATVSPDDATDKSVTWSTSDASVATVKNGVVKALKVGTATITATAGEMSAECEITVEPTPVTGISLDKTSHTLFEGQILTLVATVTPRDATDKTVTWSSSDSSIATVTDGVVKALVPGSVVITAACSGFEATCNVTVKQVDVLTLSVDAIEVESNGGANDITISSNINWEISSDSSWCTISPTSGSGNGSFTVTTSRNMTNGNRVAIITVIGNGETDLINKKVTVTQLKDNDNGVGSGDWENRGED